MILINERKTDENYRKQVLDFFCHVDHVDVQNFNFICASLIVNKHPDALKQFLTNYISTSVHFQHCVILIIV